MHTKEALLRHLDEVHRKHPGFTELIASNCRDKYGNTSYDLLLNLLDKKQSLNVLDIACGSGYLLNLCYKRFGGSLKLTGVDMSSSELELARKKLNSTNYKLHLGMAQDLSFLENSSFDAILCHWALTLMDPIVPVLDNIYRLLKNKGFSILREKKIQIEKSEAEQFYKVHETKPFYNDLCTYLSSGPIVVMVLEKDNAILGNRELMGATNPQDAEDGTIRKRYGISIDKNSVHGSDSVENAKIEIDFFFKD